jgi:hypothetical protein
MCEIVPVTSGMTVLVELRSAESVTNPASLRKFLQRSRVVPASPAHMPAEAASERVLWYLILNFLLLTAPENFVNFFERFLVESSRSEKLAEASAIRLLVRAFGPPPARFALGLVLLQNLYDRSPDAGRNAEFLKRLFDLTT